MSEMFLRLADTLLAVFWLVVLIHSLRTGYLGPKGYHTQTRRARPALFWFMILIFALMVVHFGGLAVVGQKV